MVRFHCLPNFTGSLATCVLFRVSAQSKYFKFLQNYTPPSEFTERVFYVSEGVYYVSTGLLAAAISARIFSCNRITSVSNVPLLLLYHILLKKQEVILNKIFTCRFLIFLVCFPKGLLCFQIVLVFRCCLQGLPFFPPGLICFQIVLVF